MLQLSVVLLAELVGVSPLPPLLHVPVALDRSPVQEQLEQQRRRRQRWQQQQQDEEDEPLLVSLTG